MGGNSMKKKIICAVLLLLFHFQQAFAQQVSDFILETNKPPYEVGIIGYTGSSRSVVIPNEINGMPVTWIGEEAFAGKQLTSVSLPDSLIGIGERAFMGNFLTSVIIPNVVEYIKEQAFFNNHLANVSLPGSLIEIWARAFQNNELTSIIIPDSVYAIDDWAFASNPLTSVTIGAVSYLGYRASIIDYDFIEIVTTDDGNFKSGRQPPFENAYYAHGAGTYTRPNAESREWTWRERVAETLP
jgi:hypothetical protein